MPTEPSKHRFPTTPVRGIAASADVIDLFFVMSPRSEAGFYCDPDTHSAIVDICGPLVQHGEGGIFQSYDEIRAGVVAALASDAERLVLHIASPGGDFAGSLELAREIRARALAAGKPVYAFTDTQALSAAYAIACSAERIVITPSATVGSVGVWAPLIDTVAQDRAAGVRIEIVASGTRKADRNPHVPITDDAVARLSEEVDAMAADFFGLVRDLRAGPPDVEKLQGATEFGKRAVAAKLADVVVETFDAFLASVAANQEITMPKFLDERNAYRAKVAKMAAEDSEDGRMAADELARMKAEDEKKEAKAAEEEGEAEANAEDGDKDGDEMPKKEAKAEGGEEMPEKKAAASAHVIAPTSNELTLAARVQALEASIAAEREASERKTLLASRPDFPKDVKATLAGASLDFVRKACTTWPRIATSAETAAQALTPAATQGAGHVNRGASQMVGEETEAEFIARKMGFNTGKHNGIKAENHSLSLGFMTKEEARAHVAKLEKEGK